MKSIDSVVIAGGGTAGWMTAFAMTKLLGASISVTLIESKDVPAIGVGEATIPPLVRFHEALGIDEKEFVRHTNATFKLGIQFEGWKNSLTNYIHPFGDIGKSTWAGGFHNYWLKAIEDGLSYDLFDFSPEIVAVKQNRFSLQTKPQLNYAYHLDAAKYAEFLKKHSLAKGLTYIQANIDNVLLDEATGNISSLVLDNGELAKAGLFIDCTGFKALLMEKALSVGFEDWSHWLPCDKAWVAQSNDVELNLVTKAIAHKAGWQWRIPLQNRMGNGYVFSSKFMDAGIALEDFTSSLNGGLLAEPRLISFKTGRRLKQWHKNCVAIGLSSGFIEPMESTSIHLIQSAIIRLLRLFPSSGINDLETNYFNREAQIEIEHIRDFIIAHYHVSQRNDSNFWNYCRNMQVPESLQQKIDLFRKNGRLFCNGNELFKESSWLAVLVGQGVIPESYHVEVNSKTQQERFSMMQLLADNITKNVANLPDYRRFLREYL